MTRAARVTYPLRPTMADVFRRARRSGSARSLHSGWNRKEWVAWGAQWELS